MDKLGRPNRGPLRAISNIHVINQQHDLRKYESVGKINKQSLPSNEISSDPVGTPFMRVSSALETTDSRKTSWQMSRNISFNEKQKCTSTTDIRHHFPIRSSITANWHKSHSPSSKDLSMSTSMESLYNSISENRKRSSPMEMELLSKQMRFNEPDQRRLTMGAYVKLHPRYFRRKSDADYNVPSENRLSPVCTVPIPFESSLLTRSITSESSLPTRCNVETQTSPLDDTKTSTKNKNRRHTDIHRRNSGTMQMMCSLRRKFGHLRRALSADRLNRSTRTTSTSTDLSTDEKVVSAEINQDERSKCYTTDRVHPVEVKDFNLSCEVVKKYNDGSIQIMLRRSSTSGQFGFFIARDNRGIYVSRLGSVKSVAKLWNTIHVGDRILEVQNLSCHNMGIDDVRNLIRGCELVQFRLRPATMDPIINE